MRAHKRGTTHLAEGSRVRGGGAAKDVAVKVRVPRVQLLEVRGKELVPAGSPAPGKWKLIPNTDEFLAHAIKAKDKNKPSDVILFCHELDADGAAFRDCVKLRFSKSTALESLSDADRRWSSTGWQQLCLL